MNITIENMRDAVIKVYGNDTWEARVKGMSDAQVMAIFYNFVEHGKIVEEKAKVCNLNTDGFEAALAREEERVRKMVAAYYGVPSEILKGE